MLYASSSVYMIMLPHFLGKLVNNHLPQVYFSIGFLFLLKPPLEYFIFFFMYFSCEFNLSGFIMQKSYETKQYKKGLKAADAILKKFPSHGGETFLLSLLPNLPSFLLLFWFFFMSLYYCYLHCIQLVDLKGAWVSCP